MKQRFFIGRRYDGDHIVIEFDRTYPSKWGGYEMVELSSNSVYFGSFGWANGWWFGGLGPLNNPEAFFEEMEENEVEREQYELAFDNCKRLAQYISGLKEFDWTLLGCPIVNLEEK